MDFHPIANVFPMMNRKRFAEHVEDIRSHGQAVPILLFEGKILDGRNRWLACEKLGIDARTEDYTGDDPVSLVWSLNGNRRDLTESQRGIAAAKLAEYANGTNQYKTKEGRPAGTPTKIPTMAEAAAQAGVGHGTIARGKQVLRDGAQELIEAVENGDVRMRAAADIATLPKDEQVKVVAEIQEGKMPREALRERGIDIAAPKPPERPAAPVTARPRRRHVPPQCSGIFLAEAAIRRLEEIEPNDTELNAALDLVQAWINNRRKR